MEKTLKKYVKAQIKIINVISQDVILASGLDSDTLIEYDDVVSDFFN